MTQKKGGVVTKEDKGMRNIFRKIQKVMFYSLSMLHLLGMCTIVHTVGQDELWQKAVKIAEVNQWIPGRIVENEKIFNIKGKLEEQTETHVQLLRQNSDKVEWKLLKCIKNGKDITQKVRKEVAGISNTKKAYEILDLENHFEPLIQEKISAKRLQQYKTIQRKRCVGFQYTCLTDDGKVEGVAWIEEHTGVLYETHSAVSGSFEEDGFKISKLKQIDRYRYTARGEWYLVESMAEMNIEIKNLQLEFKGQVHAVSAYSQHWKW
jgi:hypothetical protein